jgi:hypothetical protein
MASNPDAFPSGPWRLHQFYHPRLQTTEANQVLLFAFKPHLYQPADVHLFHRTDGQQLAFTVSGSRRWANEGYIEGTFYNAYAYFVGAEKKINARHSLALTAFVHLQNAG